MILIVALPSLFILTIILTILLFREKHKTKIIAEKIYTIEESRDRSLEYIEALWRSQKGLIMDEKLLSLNHLISRISHELNTPLGVTLTAVSYINDIISSDKGRSIYKETDPMLKLALSSLQKSIALVKTFSEISGEQSYDRPEPVKILDFFEYVCSGFKFQNTILDVKENFTVKISQYNLSLIIKKIMDNAFDFTIEKEVIPKIIITAEYEDRDLIIKIQDNGIGISKKAIEKIFDPLFTTRPGDSHHGLGLAIAYNLLTNHYNGKLECLSTVGVGTTIIINIPKVVCKKAIYITS